jgi:hypothetical protein
MKSILVHKSIVIAAVKLVERESALVFTTGWAWHED